MLHFDSIDSINDLLMWTGGVDFDLRSPPANPSASFAATSCTATFDLTDVRPVSLPACSDANEGERCKQDSLPSRLLGTPGSAWVLLASKSCNLGTRSKSAASHIHLIGVREDSTHGWWPHSRRLSVLETKRMLPLPVRSTKNRRWVLS